MEVVCSRLGLLKIASHAAKYASFAVNGLLIGTINQNVITVKDAIPLFHFNLSLSPFLDFALLTVDQYCSQKNLKIVGYYHGNQLKTSDLDPIAIQIATKLNDLYGNCCLLQIDDKNFLSSDLWVQPYHSIDGHWKANSQKFSVEENALKSCRELVEKKDHLLLIDFDDHLDDVSLDWTNLNLNKIYA